MSEVKWVQREGDESVALSLSRELNDIPLPLARVLVNRGIVDFDSARAFFRPSESALIDPVHMLGISEASERLAFAIENGERILVAGDYDADGVISTSIAVRGIRELGGTVDWFVPDRRRHGYGLSDKALPEILSRKPELVLTVDNGITAVSQIATLKAGGIDVIVTDHHLPAPELPDCIIVNPNQPDCEYPNKDLCGSGVIFKLLQCLMGEDVLKYIHLVAIATTADVMGMTPENRAILSMGISRMYDDAGLGLGALAAISNVDLARVTTTNFGFHLGPRLNAAGRVSDAGVAVRLLLSDDPDMAAALATRLGNLNLDRRAISAAVGQEASDQAKELLDGGANALVLFDPEWNAGVTGISASRVTEDYRLPALLLSGKGDVIKGSARSIPGLSIRDCLEECEHLLLGYGGHDAAAGASLKLDDLEALREAMDAAVLKRLEGLDTSIRIEYDSAVEVSALTSKFIRVLEQMDPFSQDCPEPVFLFEGVKVEGRPFRIGKDKSHLKLRIHDDKRSVSAIAFGFGHMSDQLRGKIDILATVGRDEWSSKRPVQLIVKDVRPTPSKRDRA